VRREGWERLSSAFGDPGTFRSVAEIVDGDSLAQVRAFKQEMKAAAKKAGATSATGASARGNGGRSAQRRPPTRR
jgi:hypothetical protein